MTNSRARDRILIIIPAWNEEEVLGSVLDEVREHAPKRCDILVVSDGSTDSTATIARAHGVDVLDLPLNLGVGGAMRAGFVYARRLGYGAAIQLDADGQHDPRDIPTLMAAAQDKGADIVIGARFAGTGNYEVHGPRKWAMQVLSFILSRVSHTELTDTTSGFKLYGARALDLFSAVYPAEYLGDTIDALVLAARAGLSVTQVGVQMRPRSGGTASHNPIQAAIYLGRSMLSLLVALSRPKKLSIPTRTGE